MKNTKQVIVIRRDLKMRRGKECSQSAHAAMMWLSYRVQNLAWWQRLLFLFLGNWYLFSREERDWLEGSFAKICLQVDSSSELYTIDAAALAAGLTTHIVTDSGKTEFNGIPTTTALCIGPHEAEKIDEVTGKLKLY